MTIKVTKPEINLIEKLNDLDFDRVPFQKMPAGSVLQVVEGTTSSDTSTTSTSFVATSLSANISPSNTSSKIMVIINAYIYTTTNNQFACDVYRGSTSITGKTAGFIDGWYESTRGRFPVNCCLLDSPSTTSSTTYKLYIRSQGGGTISFPNQPTSMKITITLMEIAG
jgi:hypothetical protein